MVQTNHTLRQRVAVLRWIIPAVLVIITLFYELGPARWLQDNLHDPVDLEILLYGVLSPLLAFWVLTLIGRWLDKTDRAEQARASSDRRLAAIMSASADAILGAGSQQAASSRGIAARNCCSATRPMKCADSPSSICSDAAKPPKWSFAG